jgi:hypothetical protein
MTSFAETAARPAAAPRSRALLAAEAALWTGAATALAFTLVWFLAALTPGEGEAFRHAGDYWYTGLGLPMVAVPLVLLPALRVVQGGRDGRLGLVGIAVTSVTCVVFLAVLTASLVEGREDSWGPTYVLATLASIVGVALFCAGSFRARVLPRWIFPLWAVAWTVGGTLGPKGSQLLVGAVYVALTVALRRTE